MVDPEINFRVELQRILDEVNEGTVRDPVVVELGRYLRAHLTRGENLERQAQRAVVSGDKEAAKFFQRAKLEDYRHAEQAKTLLESRLHKGSADKDGPMASSD